MATAMAPASQGVTLRVVTVGNASGALTGPVAGMVARVDEMMGPVGAGSPAHVTDIVAGTGTGTSSMSCSRRARVP